MQGLHDTLLPLLFEPRFANLDVRASVFKRRMKLFDDDKLRDLVRFGELVRLLVDFHLAAEGFTLKLSRVVDEFPRRDVQASGFADCGDGLCNLLAGIGFDVNFLPVASLRPCRPLRHADVVTDFNAAGGDRFAVGALLRGGGFEDDRQPIAILGFRLLLHGLRDFQVVVRGGKPRP